MARGRETIPSTTTSPAGPVNRRAVLTFGAPALGVAGLALVPVLPAAARGVAASGQPAVRQDADEGAALTAHREAYYRRARF